MERLDRMLVSAEARRAAALRELDCHRSPLAQKLRRSIAQAEHAELAVEAPRIAADPAPDQRSEAASQPDQRRRQPRPEDGQGALRRERAAARLEPAGAA